MSERADYSSQVRRLREITGTWENGTRVHRLAGWKDIAGDAGLVLDGRREPFVITGDAVGAEAGGPGSDSHALVLTTTETGHVEDGVVTCAGPDFDEAAPELHLPFVQIVILALAENAAPDPFELESTQYLANRLPGFMVRTVPGRLWVRVSREAIRNGFRMRTLGAALIAAYKNDFSGAVKAAEVVLATGDEKR